MRVVPVPFLARVSLYVLIVTCSVLFVFLLGSFWSLSADFAHHYALVSRLADFGFGAVGSDRSLGEMNFYPNYAHALSAVLGRAFDSPFLGMHVIALAAFFATWGAIAILLRDVSLGVPPAAKMAVLAVLLLVFWLAKLEWHGREIVGNYFFSQLVGQALVVGFLVVWARCRSQNVGLVVGYVLAALVSVLAVGFHLLPAMILAGTLVLVVTIDVISDSLRGRFAVIGATCLILALALAIFLHPAFQSMRRIAENDGVLELNYLTSAGAVAVLALFLLCFCGFVVRQALVVRRDERGPFDLDVVVLYVASAAILTLLQYVALKFGAGSAYAVKKYAFSLYTGLLVVVYIHVVSSLERTSGFKALSIWSGVDRIAYAIFPGLVVSVVCLTTFPIAGGMSAPVFVELDRSIRHFRSSSSALPAGQYDVAMGVSTYGSVVDYALSVGALRMPRGRDSLDVLRGVRPAEPGMVRSLVTLGTGLARPAASCNVQRLPGGLVAAEASCVFARETLCTTTNDFSDSGAISAASLTGFGAGEQYGRWSLGAGASFVCAIPAEMKGKIRDVQVSIITGFSANGEGQRGYLSLNGSPEKEVVVAAREVVVSLGPVPDGDVVSLHFRQPGAVSPKSVGVSEDDRVLGFMVRKVELVLK
ncbi:hypothetical protein [Niveibacterium sp. COAC-50]|uniref:hypothetical protein n=1 Tax=Niveibacterium sp. COAC-50 TaxID=2729384 RepID=UPI0015534FFC|nr:hypothetical protein [Niveibacterium sp. COAC-50]